MDKNTDDFCIIEPSFFHMTKPKYGWTDICIGDLKSDSNYFLERASYILDVPMEVLDGVLSFFKNSYHPVCINIDAEGFEYIIVITFGVVHIIKESEDLEEYEYRSYPFEISELARDVYSTISENLDDWVDWNIYMEDRESRRLIIQEKLRELKKYV